MHSGLILLWILSGTANMQIRNPYRGWQWRWAVGWYAEKAEAHTHAWELQHTCEVGQCTGPHIQTKQECKHAQMFAQYVKNRWKADKKSFNMCSMFRHTEFLRFLLPRPPPSHLCLHLAEAVRQWAAVAAFLTETKCFDLMVASHGVCPPLRAH